MTLDDAAREAIVGAGRTVAFTALAMTAGVLCFTLTDLRLSRNGSRRVDGTSAATPRRYRRACRCAAIPRRAYAIVSTFQTPAESPMSSSSTPVESVDPVAKAVP
jgi:hypothetical protein